MRVWLPPRFDPNADTESSKLLKGRLADFESSHRGLRIEVRVKAEEGQTSLLNALSIASAAAPSVLPDLVALSRLDFESAALTGLLHPMDGLSTMLDDPNWYAYARELGHVQNIGYGLPFAGDALVLIHRPELEINSREDIFTSEESLFFPAGDPQALFTLSLYISAGGNLVNEQGQPALEEEPLTQTLTLIQNGIETKAVSPSLLAFESDEQAYQAYGDGREGMVIAWAANKSGAIHPIPGINAPHAFANGWMWALAGSEPEKQQIAVELAEYLIDDVFLNEWIREAGYLPTRLSQNTEVNGILESAQAIPSNDAIAVLGPIMNQALSRVLNGEQIEVIVRDALEQVK